MKDNKALGHIFAGFTIFVWGTTFISTKVLLRSFVATEILICRFLIGFVLLLVAYPKPLKLQGLKKELTFAGAGLTGVCIYYLTENYALTYSQASNVSVITSTAPFFVVLLSFLLFKDKSSMKWNFFVGFVISMLGISLISFNGSKLQLNPIGDMLALGSAIAWAVYSVIVKNMSKYGINLIQSTRRIFFYGILFMLPFIIFSDFNLELSKFSYIPNLLNMLFLGACASAICFVTWNYSVKALGPVKTSTYIYLVPAITVVFSAIILNEKITLLSGTGTILAILGLVISEYKFKKTK